MIEEVTGKVSAGAYVHVTDIRGNHGPKRISLGTQYGVTLKDAQEMIKQARNANAQSDIPVHATFTVEL